MNCSELIQLLNNQQFFEQNPIVCFTSQSYPLLFFSLLFKNIKRNLGYSFKTITLDALPLAELKAQLEVAFLGESYFYWVCNLSMLDAKSKKEFCAYFNTYRGPHRIWLFAEQADLSQITGRQIITLENTIDMRQFERIQSFMVPSTNYKTHVAIMQKLFAKHEALALDEWSLLFHYTQLLNIGTFDEFYKFWIDMLLIPEKSLFDLSTHFFAKQSSRFFGLWKKIAPEYAAPFWFVYWSDQLYRATSFVRFSQAQQFNQAKKIGYKLPFSFIKKDWQLSSVQTLTIAHNDLYNFDFQVKNGGSDRCLELFYLKFLTNQYE